MKYDIVTVYNCISEKTNFIAETTEDIKNLKQDLEKEERKVDIVTVQYSILKSLIGLHEMVLYIGDIKTDRSQDDYLMYQIITARILTTYLSSKDETIEMVYQHNPGFDAISSILYAIDNWNYPNTKLIEGYSKKRKELGNALSASVHGIFDMYNHDNVYLRSFIFALEKYTTNIEDFDKVSYDDSNDMTMIKNFNKVDELDMEKAQNVSKILSITNRLYTYYDESMRKLY